MDRIRLLQERLEEYMSVSGTRPASDETEGTTNFEKAVYYIPTIIEDWMSGKIKWRPGLTYLYQKSGDIMGLMTDEELKEALKNYKEDDDDVEGAWMETCTLDGSEASSQMSEDNNPYSDDQDDGDEDAFISQPDIPPPFPTNNEEPQPQQPHQNDPSIMSTKDLCDYLYIQAEEGKCTDALLPLEHRQFNEFDNIPIYYTLPRNMNKHEPRWKLLRDLACRSLQHYLLKSLGSNLVNTEIATSCEGYQILAWVKRKPDVENNLPVFLRHPCVIYEIVKEDEGGYLKKVVEYLHNIVVNGDGTESKDDEEKENKKEKELEGPWLLVDDDEGLYADMTHSAV